MKEKNIKKVILITGVSSGFGKECARLLAEAGHTVYGTVRREFTELKSVKILKMDLTDVESIHRGVEEIISKEGRIDVLINNAGMHSAGPVETTPPKIMRLQMETSFMGMVHLTRFTLPHMRAQRGGTIINFSSIGGLMGLPFHSSYSAAKFAVEGFSEALRMEVSRFNIKVVVINPGDFRTGATLARRNFLAPTGENDPYKKPFTSALSVMEKNEQEGRNPLKLALKITKIVNSRNPRQRYIIGAFYERAAVKLKYLLPGKFFRWILEKNYKI